MKHNAKEPKRAQNQRRLVALRLSPDEYQALANRAQEDERSIAWMARAIILQTLENKNAVATH